MTRCSIVALTFTLAALSACSGNNNNTDAPDAGVMADAETNNVSTSDMGEGDASTTPDMFDPQPGEPVLVHNFGEQTLDGGEETSPCIQWTFNNSEPIYVNKVTMSNDGAYHHSNWIVVPDTSFPGPDGFFDCSSRGYSEINAAIQGTVLFAQSTQARDEVQELPEGVVIKIPPFHKVIAGGHLLNISPRPVTTGLRMRLDLVHPRDVETVVTPFRLSYYDLAIQPNGETRVTGECDLATPWEDFTGEPMGAKLYWVLPHYHELGNYFRLDVVGGPMDGQNLFELEGFNAEANGQGFSPPIDLTGATGLKFSCGFNNPRDEEVGWGIGDQEMCVMLGLMDADAMFDAAVVEDNAIVGTDADDRTLAEGPCEVTMLPKNASQAMPSQEEIDAPLYVPESDEDPGEVTVIPDCEDTPVDTSPSFTSTLTSVQDAVFVPGCTFSSCHDPLNPAHGLDLKSPDLHTRLMAHEVQSDTDLPLVAAGDAEGSWLYQIMSKCDPPTNSGTAQHMPRNSPTLLDPGLVAMVREWIDNGAQDN